MSPIRETAAAVLGAGWLICSQLQAPAGWPPAKRVVSRLTGALMVVVAREQDADAPFASPDHVSMLPRLAGHNVQGDLMRNTSGTHNVERRTTRREVTNSAINTGAIELNRSGLQDSNCLGVERPSSIALT